MKFSPCFSYIFGRAEASQRVEPLGTNIGACQHPLDWAELLILATDQWIEWFCVQCHKFLADVCRCVSC